MAVSVPYAAAFPDGTAYPTIPGGTTTVNVSSNSQLSAALSSATAGQKIVLANGSYSGTFTISGKNGTSSSGISIEAASTGGAVFASGSKFTISNCAYVTVKGLSFPFDVAGDLFQFRGTTHHSRVTRCTFGPTSHTASSEVATYIYVGDNCQHVRIDHNEVRNKGTSGNGVRVYGNFDTFVGCKYVRIDHNIFRSIKPEVGNDKEPVRYGVSTMSRTDANGVIERNFFTDCLCEPEIISVKMGKIRVTGNTIYRCAGGAVIRHGRNSILSDNYIIDGNNTTASAGLQSGGIRFYDSGHEISYNYINATIGDNFQDPLLLDTGDAEGSSTNLSAHWRVINALVTRNALVATPRGITIGDNYSSAPQNCTITDNVVVNTPTGTELTQRIAPSGGTISGNKYFASTTAAAMTQGADTIWRKADYGPRLTYLVQADVGPTGDTGDSDGTGALVTGGAGGTTPATVLNIGSAATQQHLNLTYGADNTSGGSQITKTLAEVEGGFSDSNYFSVVDAAGTAQTLGVGGIPTPAAGAGVVLISADSGSTLNITTNNVIYDGQGHTVPKINIAASGVTVQNFYVRGGTNSGIYSLGSNNTIQNNDIANIVSDGDINGITFFGDGTRVLFNKIDNLVSGDPLGSHTDGIQTWATPSKNSSSNVTIKGNWINGPVQSDPKYIHQGVMAEGPESDDGGGGGTGVSRNWVVDGNYFKTYGNQAVKFDDIHDVTITRNTFAGSATKIVETGSLSTGISYYRDNTVTGSYGSTGVSTIASNGPGGTASTTKAVQFRVRADAATGGASFPRNELREVLADGSTYAFNAMVGDHSLHTRARITHLPTADPEVIVAQLHNGTNDRVAIKTALISGATVLLCSINGVNQTPQFANPYTVGTEFEIQIKVLDGGAVQVFYNGATTPQVTGQLTTTGSASWFFRVGAHAQFNTSSVTSTEYVTVEHRDIQISHSGAAVSAGADTLVTLGHAFTRTATETAISGVTSRSWDIVSGPVGGSADVPTGTVTEFEEGFESGNFDQFLGVFAAWLPGGWIDAVDYDQNGSYALKIVDGGAGHPHVARFELRDGDISAGSERVELEMASEYDVVEGDERWYEFDVKFGDPTWNAPISNDWCIFWQWHHQSGSGSPPLDIDIFSNNVVHWGGDGVPHEDTPIFTATSNQWRSIVFHVKFSTDDAIGYVEAWVDGVQTVPRQFRATMIDAANSLKFGLYRNSSNTATQVIMFDNIRISSGPVAGGVDTTTAAGRYGWGDPIAAWSDEFNYTGAPNNSKWSVYNGVGHDGNGRRRPERANVDGSKLVMDGLTNGDSAGMASRFEQQYGRYEVRARSFNTGTTGEEYSPVLLIWPESDSRSNDGEYDFAEPGRPGGTTLTAFMHFPGDGDQQREFNKTGVNMAEWHNFAFEWTPNYLKGYIDGVEWFSTSGGANSTRDNIQDMPAGHLCIQLDNFNGDSGNRPARFEVDWARVYSLTPTGGGGATPTTQLSTSATVNWTPTILGVYTLRYTVVAPGGTFADEVLVSVGDLPTGPQTITPNSIASDERWGQPIVEVAPPAGAVPSLLGAMVLNETAYLGYAPGPGARMIVPVSIPSAEHWGSPTVVVEDPPLPQDIYPESIPSRERWGRPVVRLGAAPPDLPVTDITVSVFAIDPSEGRGLPLPDFTTLTLSPERNSAGSITLEYPAEGINFGFLREAITDGRDVQIEIWVSGTSNKALRGYLQEAQGDDTDEDGELWTFGGQFLEVRMSEAIIEPQDLGPSPAMAAELIVQRMVAGGSVDNDLTWDGAPEIVETYAPLILEQWIEDRPEEDTSPIPNLEWLREYVGEPSNQEHANEKREMIFASATPGQVMIYAMDQARRRGTLTDVAVDFTLDHDSDGTEWPQVISTRFSPGVEYTRILDRLVELGLAEWAVEWTGTAQVLRMWVPEGRGRDLTENDPPLVLRHGQNLLDAPHKWSVRDTGTYVLVAGADGLYDAASDPTAQAVRGRRIERYTSANNLNTPTSVEAYAQKQLTVVTTPLLEVTHGIGMQPGSPRPIASFDVGDWLYSDTDGILNRYRVVQWTLTVNNDQSLSGTVTLNDTTADALLRLKAQMDALTAGETVVGTSEGAFQSDDGVPLAPTGVVASSTWFMVMSEPSPTTGLPPSGEPHAAVTVGWLPVTLNTNGSAASDLGGYKVQYAYDQEPDLWIGLEDVGPNRQSSTFDASPGVNLMVRVAAYDRNGNVSDWSEIVHHSTAVDDQPPAAPSAPVVTDYLGTIRVFWDGNTSDGVDMVLAAPDFDYIEVHMDAGSNFIPSGSTKVGQMRGPGAFSITDLAYGVTQFVRLVAIDKGGNPSTPSAQGSATPGKLVNIDIGPDAISRVQIIDGEIVTAKIADLAVNDAKIMNLSVGKLTAGFLSADVIMSTGEIRTGTGNTYGIFSSGGIQFYRAGILTVDLNAATGDALMTGTYRSGLVGERINILPDGTLRIFGASGTDYGEIANEGGAWRARSRADAAGNRSVIYFNPSNLTAVYGNSSTVYSRFDTGITYGVFNAPVTGIRVWTQHAPTDGTENRFHMVHATSSGDLNDTVLHYIRNDFKGDDPSILAPGLSPEGAGITWSNNAIAATRGNGNAYVFVDGADFRALSSELQKRDIAPIAFAGGRSARDVVDSVASYGFIYDWPIEPRTVPVERRQPDGSMKVVQEDVDVTPGPPRRHFFPLAEHLAKVAPELVQTTPQGQLAVGMRDAIGVLWENSRELSRELRELRRLITGQPDKPVVVEGTVIDRSRWAQLPEGVQCPKESASTSTPTE